MILATDVYYYPSHAKATSLAFNNWEEEKIVEEKDCTISDVAEYSPGSFFKRELPCLLKVIALSNTSQIEAIIIDGYVFLDDNDKKGLGGYLYQALDQQIPIIGVAKRKFHSIDQNAIAITRGKSLNPLFITSVGIDLEESAKHILNMKGDFRIPQLLKKVDADGRS